jgi:hypothetical protein
MLTAPPSTERPMGRSAITGDRSAEAHAGVEPRHENIVGRVKLPVAAGSPLELFDGRNRPFRGFQ